MSNSEAVVKPATLLKISGADIFLQVSQIFSEHFSAEHFRTATFASSPQ